MEENNGNNGNLRADIARLVEGMKHQQDDTSELKQALSELRRSTGDLTAMFAEMRADIKEFARHAAEVTARQAEDREATKQLDLRLTGQIKEVNVRAEKIETRLTTIETEQTTAKAEREKQVEGNRWVIGWLTALGVGFGGLVIALLNYMSGLAGKHP